MYFPYHEKVTSKHRIFFRTTKFHYVVFIGNLSRDIPDSPAFTIFIRFIYSFSGQIFRHLLLCVKHNVRY